MDFYREIPAVLLTGRSDIRAYQAADYEANECKSRLNYRHKEIFGHFIQNKNAFIIFVDITGCKTAK